MCAPRSRPGLHDPACRSGRSTRWLGRLTPPFPPPPAHTYTGTVGPPCPKNATTGSHGPHGRRVNVRASLRVDPPAAEDGGGCERGRLCKSAGGWWWGGGSRQQVLPSLASHTGVHRGPDRQRLRRGGCLCPAPNVVRRQRRGRRAVRRARRRRAHCEIT